MSDKLSDQCALMIEAWQQVQSIVEACPEATFFIKPEIAYDNTIRAAWVNVPLESLPKLRNLTGHVKVNWKTADGPEHVHVLLECEKLPFVKLYYRKPYAGNGRCKIVQTEVKIESTPEKPPEPARVIQSYQLVCPTR